MTGVPKNVSPIADLARGITDAAFVVDLNRNILEFNRAFINIHKVDRRTVNEVKGQFCRKHVNMEICSKDCIVLKSIESGATVRFDEVQGKSSDGGNLNLIVSAVPIRNESGEIVSVLEIQRDVTDEARIHDKYRVLLEKEKRAKEDLEKQVQERTKELRHALEELKRAESQLVQSEKMSSLGQMVAGIAHELNNPINYIYGNVEVMKEHSASIVEAVSEIRGMLGGSPEWSKKLKAIEKNRDLDFVSQDLEKILDSVRKGSERAAEIIRGLRSFSRLDEAQLKEVNLHEDLDTTLVLLRHNYKDRVTIQKEYGQIPLVNCYSSQLNQVFMNLIHNAVQAIDGEGTVTIRTFTEGKNVVIEISDSGVGIPPDNLKKIFDPFFTTKPVGQGTGLGLSITYGIVQRHHGSIDVKSEVGHGTTFRVTIPQDPVALPG